jgi:phage baseplate assembly protein W|tara:strand:+ start:321 stop:761 length:441 start_codon:yes stop_codon:yes gene_type:complete
MTYKDYTFSDLDVDLSRNSITGDITLKKDLQSIRQSITNILLTRPKERFFSSSGIGVGLQDLIFELKDYDGVILSSIKERVKSNINKFEPRVRFREFTVVDDEYNSLGDSSVIVEILYDVISFGNNSNITETSNIADGVRLTIGNE